ncbi:MAG TPA: DUF4173 domain-containing protein [Roseiflexaceae bacterium]|nr:DUF4173 domain-containing protein [Roseiflexaceae bacterium]
MHALRHPSRLLLTAVALGVCADQLFYGRWLGVSAPLFVSLGLAALASLAVAEQRAPTRANLWLGGAALFFALCLAWRDAPALIALNLLALFGLLLLMVANYRGDSLARLPGLRALVQLFVAPLEIGARPGPLLIHSAGQIQIEPGQTRRLLPVGRGLALATPVLACFTALLMAADSVFASYVTQVLSLQLPFDVSTLIGHLALTTLIGWGCCGGLLAALASDARSPFAEMVEAAFRGLAGLVYAAPALPALEELPSEGATQRLLMPKRPPLALGWVESLTILVSVDLLFGSFMAIQGAYFFGGLNTLDRTGMTFAEYARRGFFELVAVACLALGMLCALAVAARRETPVQRRAFNAASGALIALVLGLVASAHQRMSLYEQAYGYTQLRLYTHGFMIWLALVLGLFLLALLRGRPRVFILGGFGSALAFLALLNIANPDALIVRENIAHYQAGGKIDTYYLSHLSADATPDLVAVLDLLDDGERSTIVPALQRQHQQLADAAAEQGWPSWQVGRARAVWAIGRAGIPPAAEEQRP